MNYEIYKKVNKRKPTYRTKVMQMLEYFTTLTDKSKYVMNKSDMNNYSIRGTKKPNNIL